MKCFKQITALARLVIFESSWAAMWKATWKEGDQLGNGEANLVNNYYYKRKQKAKDTENT